MPITIEIEGRPLFDQRTQSFLPRPKSRQIRLEHSLISMSRWEEETKRKFFSKLDGPQSTEDILFYIKCMSLDGPIDDNLLRCISKKELERVGAYISDNRTATTFAQTNSKGKAGTMTSEVLYYYIAAFQLPPYVEKWHLSRLLTLIRVANAKQAAAGKKGKKDGVNYQSRVDSWARLNEKNKARLGTSG